ncbi:uncharacterized protein CXorf58 homolog isoform 1-T2 [Trichechus inunguis]
MFQLLKHTICAAEHHVSYDILKKVSPLEAKLIKDPSMKYKVRFRFSGEDFPPFIVFKIFLHAEGGRGYKYINGKSIMKPSSEAVVDACKIMGKRKFIGQVLEDEHLFQKFKVTDVIDIVTMKDYMQYTSLMDEIPAYSGGRNNHWRRLTLENFPKAMMIYDIVDYAESGVISSRLQKEMKYLSQRPKTEEMRQHQLQIVSEVRSPSPSLTITPLYRPYKKQSPVKHLGRRSKKAQIKVEKMRKAYKVEKEKKASLVTVTEPKTGTPHTKKQEIIVSTPSFDIVRVQESMSDEEWRKEEKELFAWSEKLCFDNSPSS